MTTTNRKAAAAVIASLTLVVSPANAASSSPPKLHRMHWFHWHASARTLQSRADTFGSTAVIGLESMADLARLRAAYGFDHVRAIPDLHAAEVSVDDAQLHALLANAPGDPHIRYVSPLGPRRHPLAMPNDPLLQTIDPTTNAPYEWQFRASHVDQALDLSQGSSTILVGTIDSGVGDVPDLAGKIDGRWFLAPDGKPTQNPPEGALDTTGHGTATASLIAANVDDGFGMAGFGGATHVISFRDDALSDTSIAIAIAKLDSLGVRIINLSIGGPTPDVPPLLDALHKAASDGILLVASAGNDSGAVNYPAADLQPPNGAQSFGLAVGASTQGGALASFSSSGKHLSLVAPGSFNDGCSGVLVALAPVTQAFDQTCMSTWSGAGGARYGYLAGTSFSAPEVAGIAALVWAARPQLKNYQVAAIIKQSARRVAGTGWTPTIGCGVLDAAAALELATGHGGTSAPARARGCSAAGRAPTWPAVPAPTATAFPAFGIWGTLVNLPFRVTGSRGDVAATIAVQKNSATIAHLSQGFFGAQSGQMYGLTWQAPATKTTGVFHFCVTLSDRAGNKSAPSCAFISLR